MEKLITIGQFLLDGLKWLMEGTHWLLLTPVVLISAYVLFKMIKKGESVLIFIWALATLSIMYMMLELVLGVRVASLIGAACSLFVCILVCLKKFHIVKKGKHAVSSRDKRRKIR
ncbi:hypothetical protein AALA44_06815 [Enterococcus ratti]|uniref:hypothetical protein n=1 Tax=Enterococcus ratti TaxID=150033 RepID=UPI003514AB92